MAYATDMERKALLDSNSSFNACPMVVRFSKKGRENELVADDVDHALNIQRHWLFLGEADYVEIFRVNDDGSLKPTIGAFYKEDVSNV